MSSIELTSSAQPQKATPVPAHERIEFVDILRGFAILGILAANMYGYAGLSYNPGSYSEPIDRAIVLLIRFFVEAKFYSLFSFLFGWGLSIQMIRAEARGVRFVPLYLRRMAILFLFGLTHAFLIWNGDVLGAYALFGCLLLLFRKRSNGFILASSGLALMLAIVVSLPALDGFRTWYENATAFLRAGALDESLFATGTYWETTRLRFQNYIAGNTWFILWFGNMFSMFLLGLYVGKRRFFQNLDQHLTLVRIVLVVGLVVGVTFTGFYALTLVRSNLVPLDYQWAASRGARTLGAPALMLFYMSTIILLVRRKDWHRRLIPLASVGRAALSNYLLQSVICTLLFNSYGLGLYGQIDPLLGLILTIVIFVTQIRLSEGWFARFRFGPLEWLWRTLTYGQVQPLRLKPAYQGGTSALQRRIRQTAARVNPQVALAVAWVVLLLWTAALGFWVFRLETRLAQINAAIPQVVARTTATPVTSSTAETPPEEQPKALATPIVQPVVYNPGPLAASGDLGALASAFDAESALAQIEALAGPSHQGRYPTTAGSRAAGDYIAEQFARYGLQPAGGDGSFFQSFPFEYIGLASTPRLVVEGPDGAVYDEYEFHRDYSTFVRWYAGAGTGDGPVVWANHCTADDLDLVEAPGNIVFCRSDEVREAQRLALEHGADGLLLLMDAEQRLPDFGTTFFEPWVPEPIPVYWVYPTVADELLLGSGKSVEDLSVTFTSFPLETSARMRVETVGREACAAQGCRARNVLGVLPGRDPEYADQVIVLGAHYDHLGQSPNGIVWPGANDDASGVAVLLELARTWHEQGYVPRYTVLFAAWDAEEEGLFGARRYVENPRYPLDQTIAMIQLDMVGAGGDTLWIDGEGRLGDRLEALAQALDIEAEPTNVGRSDHVPFLQAGVPANLLIWDFFSVEAEYHRPVDTPETIDLDKLEAVGQIVGLTVLGLSEGEPAIDALLARRAAAVAQGDLDAFLATSLPEQQAADRFWFADAQALAPQAVEMQATDIRILGRDATATVHLAVQPAGSESEAREASLAARFVHDGRGWRWAGPNLAWLDSDADFAVAYPPGREAPEGLGQFAAEKAVEMAATLGLPPSSNANLLLFPNAESLRASTALSLPSDQDVWVGPGLAKLIYSQQITSSAQLTDTLVHLLLADAGVTEAAAPWLWRGLPLALRGQADPVATQMEMLPRLRNLWDKEPDSLSEASAWAAVDYVRQEIGWLGVGRLVASLGQACRDGLCETTQGLDLALDEVLQTDASGFEAAWQGHWQARLDAAQAALDAVLEKRAEAVLDGDEQAFLETVDAAVPNLLAEEQHWFADLVQRAPERLDLSGQPLALLDDGGLLASVTLDYRLADSTGEDKVSLVVHFTPGEKGYEWAGAPFESLQDGPVRVLYPAGHRYGSGTPLAELAQTLATEAGAVYTQLAADLGLGNREGLTFKLYADDAAFRTSISLALPRGDGIAAWSAGDESVKLRVQSNTTFDELRSILAAQVTRRLLADSGVDSEWLLKGMSIYLAHSFDGGALEQAAAKNLNKALAALSKDGLPDLATLPPDHELPPEQLPLVQAKAWDAVRYLVYTYGEDALWNLLSNEARGQDLGAALQSATGQSLAEFEAAWAESAARAHADPEWVDVANAFDPERVQDHIDALARPELAGRQAGSPGAEAAAVYIANEFAQAGLAPVGDGASFFQYLPITYTTLLAAPRLEIVDDSGQTLDAFVYREDFILPPDAAGNGDPATGELVWVRDGDLKGMDLAGKIAVLQASDGVAAKATQAAEHGAAALLIAGGKESGKDLLAKAPLPVDPVLVPPIPVLELTPAGFERLLRMAGYARPSDLGFLPAVPLGIQAQIEVPIGAPQVVETANVLGLLPGSDPVLKDEILILGAHYDHVGDDPDALLCSAESAGGSGHAASTTCQQVEGRHFAGANDDASGVGVLLEMARLWHETGYRPRRSILFAAWGAQEVGELGSSYYVEYPVLPLEQTVAMLQLDSVGGGDGYYLEAQGGGGPEALLLFNLTAANDWVDGRLAVRAKAGQSDQVPFREAGVPALLLTWREASEDNWPVELADEIDPYRLGVTGRMVTLAVMATAR